MTTGVLETSTWATDEISSTQYQRVKISRGVDGTARDAGTLGSNTSLTFAAGLQSLASSTTAGTASAEVDLTGEAAQDVAVVGQFQMTTAGSPTGYVDVFVIWSNDGTIYTGDTSYSGTAAAYTLGAAGSANMTLLFSVKPHANTAAYQGGASLRAVLGFVPPFFALVVLNSSGIALHSSGNGATYRIQY